MSGSYLEQMMDEFRWGPYWVRRLEFADESPEVWQIPFNKDPYEIIKSCRPEAELPTNGAEF